MSSNSKSLSLDEIVRTGVKLTPMMQQYFEIKSRYKETLLMFRMGDFYEVFFEDAVETSRLLNISLTHRGKLGEHPIPMAGIPHHAATTYIDKLTGLGRKVAICEQVEDPKQAKGIVKRAVTQVVSPGIPYDLDKSETKQNHFIACVHGNEGQYFLVLIDFTTGEFFGLKLKSIEEVLEKLFIFSPKEFICYLGQWSESEKMTQFTQSDQVLCTHLSEEYFSEKYTALYIEKLIATYRKDQIIMGEPELLAPMGALSYYLCSTLAGENLSHLQPFQLINHDEEMKITYPTLVGLEIFPKDKDRYKDSLLGFMDSTRTAMGARKLKNIFQAPSRSQTEINHRLDTIEYFIQNISKLEEVRDKLFNIRDIERILAKASTGKINSSDLINLSRAYDEFNEILKVLKKNNFIKGFSKREKEIFEMICGDINKAINDEMGASLDKGNLIKPAFDKKRDRLANLKNNAREDLIALETRYREETGIGNLKVKYNNVAGYFIEVSKSHVNKVPKNFVRRQTLVNSERFQSEELAEFEKEVIAAKDKLYQLERKIFTGIVEQVKKHNILFLKLAQKISQVDINQSFAWISHQEGFTRPHIVQKQTLKIKNGWHPLIKANLRDRFVHHNLRLDETIFFGLITGPNMAGKTTVMREAAIIQFLAQLGCFVPAESATLDLKDYIFSRLGAHDDIIKGQSTFMVEMSETAEIIRHATENSLIVLDEIGRGTSTFDGLSIAWALVEHFIIKTKALTLFSTHYHELIELVHSLPQAKNLTVKTVSKNGNVQFLYELIEEGAGQSFGIHVAKLAGLPSHILKRSKQILNKLEASDHSLELPVMKNSTNQLDLFTEEAEVDPIEAHPIIKDLEKMDVMNLTPMQALQKLDELKATYLN